MITMFDNIDASLIPAGARACAGYCGGRWPDWFAMVARFPALSAQQRVLSIAVNASEKARILDVEPGDATPSQAGAWVKQMLALGVWRPGVYADTSRMFAVRASLAAAGLSRSQYVLWIADWTGTQHLPAGFDACQWTDKAGPNDQSICLDTFFPPLPAPTQPSPTPKPAKACGHFTFAGSLSMPGGQWAVHGTPSSDARFGGSTADQWASVELQVCVAGPNEGRWRAQWLPWNAPPLGG